MPPEYAELVGENVRHRLADEPAAERYEVDLLGLQGQHASQSARGEHVAPLLGGAQGEGVGGQGKGGRGKSAKWKGDEAAYWGSLQGDGK